MMHEDQLFQQFKAGLENYAPEVPAAAYGSMRKRLWLSQFLKFNSHTLNVWYIGIALAIGVGVWSCQQPTSATAQLSMPGKIDLVVCDDSKMQPSTQVAQCNSGQDAQCKPSQGLICAKTSTKCKSSKTTEDMVDVFEPLSASGSGVGLNVVQSGAETIPPTELNSTEIQGEVTAFEEPKKEDIAPVRKPKKKHKVYTYSN
jgi:hypothetical protein